MSRKQRKQVPANGADGALMKRAKPLSKRTLEQTSGLARLLSPPAEDRGRQVVRLLRLVRTLEAARRGFTVQELIDHAELDCSERTVYRDLEHLAQVGFQVVHEDGRYRIHGDTLRSDPLRPSQVLALLLAEDLFAPLRGQEIASELSALIDLLKARLNPRARAWVEEMRSLFAVSLHGAALPADQKIAQVISKAQAVEQCLRIEYEKPGEAIGARVVEPHLLWFHDSKTYLVAYCRRAESFRSFALPRIRHAELLDETFDKRPDFDASEFTRRGFGVLHGDPYAIVLQLRPSIAHLATERSWHPTQSSTPLADGSVELRMTVAGLPEVAAWVASFGGKMRAIAPPELVQLVREVHEAGLREHALTSDDKGGA